uniref:Uncharacterized protein n=1 Tax=Trichogramma kaykai TaxID=54128 RepID=A0ABD2WGI3_9HYME
MSITRQRRAIERVVDGCVDRTRRCIGYGISAAADWRADQHTTQHSRLPLHHCCSCRFVCLFGASALNIHDTLSRAE